MKLFIKFLPALGLSICLYSSLIGQTVDSASINKIRVFFNKNTIIDIKQGGQLKAIPSTFSNAFDLDSLPNGLKEELKLRSGSRIETLRRQNNWIIKNAEDKVDYLFNKKQDLIVIDKIFRTDYVIPFIKQESLSMIKVFHRFSGNPENNNLPNCYSFFSIDGHFLGSESIEKINDTRRMPVDIVEKGMIGIKDSILQISVTSDNFNYEKMWEVVGKIVTLEQIKEFNLFYVNYRYNGKIKPTIILNIWGPDNPLGMPDELPAILKNRIRIIYDPNDNSWMADNLL